MHIHLVTNTTGFPNGTAAAKRITMIGKALLASGCGFSVYTGTLKYNKFNKNAAGTTENIFYRYLHGTTALKTGIVRKLMLYIKSIIALNTALQKMNPLKDIVYIYSQGDLYNLITLVLCRFHAIKIVEEINEWDYDQVKGPLRKMIFRGPMVKWPDGAIVISKNIRDNVIQINPKLQTLVIPVLEDPAQYTVKPAAMVENRYCFWMGLVDGYIEDVLFMVTACGLAYRNGCNIDLVICGPCNTSLERIKAKALSVNYPQEKIKLVGYVSEEVLNRLCRNAWFYIVPLWQNQKSLNRFPTKIAPFMFCGKPVLTCNIGEVGHLLTDKENALFYEPGNSADLAAKIRLINDDAGLYETISSNARRFAADTFSYAGYTLPLYHFFSDLMRVKGSVRAKHTQKNHAKL